MMEHINFNVSYCHGNSGVFIPVISWVAVRVSHINSKGAGESWTEAVGRRKYFCMQVLRQQMLKLYEHSCLLTTS